MCIGGTRVRFRDTGDTDDPRNQAALAWLLGLIWARLDSNQGATDYESAALTTELRAPRTSVTQTFDGSGLRFTVKRGGEPPVG